MRLACVLVPHLPALMERHRDAALKRLPVIVYHHEQNKPVVLDAIAPGIMAGMPLQEAQARAKDVVLVQADTQAYEEAFERVLAALEERCFDVESVSLGFAYVSLRGMEGLYPSEAHLLTALSNAIPAYLAGQIGVADGKFPAYAAALQAGPSGVRRASDPLVDFLAPMPVDILPIDYQTRQRLHEFGLMHLRDLVRIGIGPLQAQFGRLGRTMLALAQGEDATPFMPRKAAEVVEAGMEFPAPVGDLDGIVHGADILLSRAFSDPIMRNRMARSCTLEGTQFIGGLWRKSMTFLRPLADRQSTLFLLKHTIEGQPPANALEDLHLTLSGLTGGGPMQGHLFADEAASARKQENLLTVAEQLAARLDGAAHLYRVHAVEPWSHIPERRALLVPIRAGEASVPLGTPASVRVRDTERHVPQRVLLDKRWHAVERVEECWVVDDEWWRSQRVRRWYFSVTLVGGKRVTVFWDWDKEDWHVQQVS